MNRPHQHLITTDLNFLHPTQITVGLRESAAKQLEWRKLKPQARKEFLALHWFPGILGPNNRTYIVDHHHLGLALLREGMQQAKVLVLKDLSWLEPEFFWRVMDVHQWVHPYDGAGQRQSYAQVPDHLEALQDDPYRSLAGELRHAGGFAKDITPYSEFLWADFLRVRIEADRLQKNFDKALQRALKLAHTQKARYLPGWSGNMLLD